ncbi:MAG: hypothetical protein ACK4NF_00980 [Planctomycetota bacterium]
MKNIIIHGLSLVTAIIIWIYVYLIGKETIEIMVKLNIELPRNFIVIEKTRDFYIKVLVETNNRYYKDYINRVFEINKKINVKGLIFPKKVLIKIAPGELKLPPSLKVIKILDDKISLSIDKLKEAILPVQLKGIYYEGKEVKNLDISIQPGYLSLKMPTGILRTTKFVELGPLILPKLPTNNTDFKIPVPQNFLPYVQGNVSEINVNISFNLFQKETTIDTPVYIIFHDPTIMAKIKAIQIYPRRVTLTVNYADINIEEVEKRIICYIEIGKVIFSKSSVPIYCNVKNDGTQIKIAEYSPLSARVRIFKRSQEKETSD